MSCSCDHLWYKCSLSTLGFDFVAVSKADCPCTYMDTSGCRNLPECSYSMTKNDLCEASKALPDGNKHYDVNNCDFGIFNDYDVFRYIGGKIQMFTINS